MTTVELLEVVDGESGRRVDLRRRAAPPRAGAAGRLSARVVAVAYDEQLAARIRALLADRTDVREQKMFGGLTFMVGGHMCCGVNRDELIVRLDPDREADALARPHARPTDLTRRPMPGFVTVRPEGLDGERLQRWVQEAVARAASLPPK
jgi:TfoX/Sxy family transcriptional regulator of competence genes